MAVTVVEVVMSGSHTDVGFYGRQSLPRARWGTLWYSVQDGQKLLKVAPGSESLEQVVWLETTNEPINTDCNPTSDRISHC